MKYHQLKSLPEYWHAVNAGRKTFEILKNDRNFKEGDVVYLNLYDPDEDKFIGFHIQRIITYISDYEQKPGYIVFGLGEIEDD